MQSAGIDITKYSAHNSRAASTFSVKVKGLNIAETIKSAGWSTVSTFARFYNKPVSNNLALCCSIQVPSNLLVCITFLVYIVWDFISLNKILFC